MARRIRIDSDETNTLINLEHPGQAVAPDLGRLVSLPRYASDAADEQIDLEALQKAYAQQ